MFVRINGQTNRLTGINHTYANENTEFHYLVTMREDGTASLRLGKGHYILKNLGAWTGTAQPLEKVEQDMDRDHFLDAEEALAYGIVDEIVPPRR